MEYEFELNQNNVELVYRQCLLNQEECKKIQCGNYCVDVTLSDSILEPEYQKGFNTLRLMQSKELILSLINQISDIDSPILPFHEARKRRDGFIWTKDARSIEKLVILGVTLGILQYYCPKQEWDKFPYGLPPIIKSDTPNYPTPEQK